MRALPHARPVVVGVGIGGTMESCALLAKRQLLRPLGEPAEREDVAAIEREALKRINLSGVGPMGLGGARHRRWRYTPRRNPRTSQAFRSRSIFSATPADTRTVRYSQMEYHMQAPLSEADMRVLRAGDVVYCTGTIYTARDAAHAKFDALFEKRASNCPFQRAHASIIADPAPPRPARSSARAGPTTSKRMDAYTPALIDYGIVQFIGKGARSAAVNAAMLGRAVHFAATGGAGMLYASRITACELVAFADLGAEAVYRLEVRDFPVVVTYDLLGNDVYARTTQN